MRAATRRLWTAQDRHQGDRHRLFQAVSDSIDAATVLYPGSFVDVAPSFVFPSVTYLDQDARTPGFFADDEGVRDIIAAHADAPGNPDVRFIHGDYTQDLGLPDESFDLLVSLYAGFVSAYCTRYLRIGGMLLVNPSHGDAALASVDRRYHLAGVVVHRSGRYRVTVKELETYLVPKRPIEVTADMLHERGRGIAYTKPAFAYLFTRVA